MFGITNQLIDTARLRGEIANRSAGAFVSFEGWVRNRNDGRDVLFLEYECYETLAMKEGTRILAQASERFEILDVHCLHRTGRLDIGELAVWVGVTAEHRGDAFEACRFVIDEVKHRVPIWKKETYSTGGTEWVNCAGCSAHSQEAHR